MVFLCFWFEEKDKSKKHTVFFTEDHSTPYSFILIKKHLSFTTRLKSKMIHQKRKILITSLFQFLEWCYIFLWDYMTFELNIKVCVFFDNIGKLSKIGKILVYVLLLTFEEIK